MANSADLDQLASSEANWSGSTLFAKAGLSGFSRTRINPKNSFKISSRKIFTYCDSFHSHREPSSDSLMLKQFFGWMWNSVLMNLFSELFNNLLPIFYLFVCFTKCFWWNGKECRSWSDCSTRRSLIWVCTVCIYNIGINISVWNFWSITVTIHTNSAWQNLQNGMCA